MSALVLEDIVRFVRRFVVLTEIQADTLALWAAHTHAADAAETTPYIFFTSAEKRSGKSTALEVLELVVHAPLPTANISDAALFRAIAELKPTLLLDEVDAIFSNKARDREDLRGLLNAGYRRGAVARRMGGAKMTTLETFPVFCAKAFAAIGNCPTRSPTGRSRFRCSERPRRACRAVPAARLARPRARVCATGSPTGSSRSSTSCATRGPSLPDELDDRAQDCGNPCWRSPTSPAVTGRNGQEGRTRALRATARAKTTR